MTLPMHTLALLAGYLLDLVFGDPQWLPHPIRWMGRFIAWLEKPVRAVLPRTDRGESIGGVLLALIVILVFTFGAWLLLVLCSRMSIWLSFVVESIICYQMLATKSLRDTTMGVYEALDRGDIECARHAVSMVVGRDTDRLDGQGVSKAAVETIAENTADGVIAPLLFMAVGGGVLGVLYKSVNTMDSMIGYRNDRYRYFGTFAARLDDVLNYLPARVAGLLMCAVAGVAGFDRKRAFAVYKRDKRNHLSPNSAHTEAACAGALGIQLGGINYYFGKPVEKPTIGDDTRPVETADIRRANRLLYATSVAGLVAGIVISLAIHFVTRGLA